MAARGHLVPFSMATWPGYSPAAHLVYLADALEGVERGEIDRLIVEMPPRHGKSELTSIRFPAWYLSRHPAHHIIGASYGAELAHSFGRRARNVMLSARRQALWPGVTVAGDSGAAHRWDTNHGGGYLAVGIPGPITGHGAHCLLVDDPLRGREDAGSEAIRSRIWEWWQADALTRLEPGGAVVICCTRWHEDDLVGRVLADEPGRWRRIRLPALAGADDPLGRAEGAALWPERFSVEELEGRRREIGASEWAALYQQEPAPPEGHIWQWWPRYQVLPENFQVVYVPIDTAYSTRSGSDYTAAAAWGVSGGRIYLIDAQRWRMEAPEAEEAVWDFWARLHNRYGERCPVTPLVRRRVAIDRVAAQHLRARRVPVVEVDLPAGNTKAALARMVVHLFQAELARIPEWAPWLDSWLHEHRVFDGSETTHDDWVETTIIAMWQYRLASPARYEMPDIRVRMVG